MHPEEELLVWGGAIRGFEARLFPKIEGGELTWVKLLVTLPVLFPESHRLLGGIIAGLWPLPSSVTSLQTEPCQQGRVAAAHPRPTWLSCSDMGSRRAERGAYGEESRVHAGVWLCSENIRCRAWSPVQHFTKLNSAPSCPCTPP